MHAFTFFGRALIDTCPRPALSSPTRRSVTHPSPNPTPTPARLTPVRNNLWAVPQRYPRPSLSLVSGASLTGTKPYYR